MRTVALTLVLIALGVGAALLVQEVPAAVLHKALRVLRMPALSWRTDGATTLISASPAECCWIALERARVPVRVALQCRCRSSLSH